MNRRQARADALSGRVRVGDRAVPVELLDIHHPVWQSADETGEWFIGHGLAGSTSSAMDHFVSRFRSATVAWAKANDLMNKTYPNTLDTRRLRGLGIQTAGFARLRVQVQPNILKGKA